MRFRRHVVFAALILAVLVSVTASVASSSQTSAIPAGDWQAFGRTPDNSRLSPLTQITPANVSQLERVYNIDFQKIDPDVRRGQQSYPLAIGGRLYVTTNDDNVFALDGATGKVIWQYKPPNSGIFKNFGIVANRGLAYCDGRLFISQLDMKLVALRPSDGKVLGVTALGNDVPNANSNYGYSETSAPICANHRADHRRGRLRVRDPRFRDGLHDRPEAGLAERRSGPSRPTSSPGGARRASSAAARSGRRPPSTRRRTRSTSAPARRRRSTSRGCGPGANPRTDSLIAVDLTSGPDEVVAAAPLRQPMGLRRLAAAARLHRQGWRQDAPRRVRRDDGRSLVRVRCRNRQAVPRARQGDRPRRAPAAAPGAAGDRLPVVARRPELLAGRLRPDDQLRLQRGRRDRSGADPEEADADAEEAEVRARRRLPRPRERQLRHGASRTGTTTGRSARSTSRRAGASGSSRRPSRSGAACRSPRAASASPAAATACCARSPSRRARCSGRSTPRRPIAAGPTIFSADGKEYVAVTVGGTPTSSNGGVASLAAGLRAPRRSQHESCLERARATHPVTTIGGPPPPRSTAVATASGAHASRSQGASVPLALWQASSSNEATVNGRLLLRGQAGLRRTHGGRPLRLPTDDRCKRPVQPAGGQDAAATASRTRRRRVARTRRRTSGE